MEKAQVTNNKFKKNRFLLIFKDKSVLHFATIYIDFHGNPSFSRYPTSEKTYEACSTSITKIDHLLTFITVNFILGIGVMTNFQSSCPSYVTRFYFLYPINLIIIQKKFTKSSPGSDDIGIPITCLNILVSS